jgi:hypothetical protein
MPEAPPTPIASFRGAVRCRRETAPPGLTLSGRSADHPDEDVTLGFAGVAGVDLPERLEDVVVESGAPGRFRIAAGARAWVLSASAVHLHREVAGAFYRAIPPRAAPRLRRMLYRVLLGIAGSRVGLAALRALRR